MKTHYLFLLALACAINAHGQITVSPPGGGVTTRSSIIFDDVNLAGGTALSLGTIYHDTLSANRTLTFSGTPASTQPPTVLRLAVTGGPRTLTIPQSYRIGDTGPSTSIVLQTGNHELSWVYAASKFWLADSSGIPPQTGDIAAALVAMGLMTGSPTLDIASLTNFPLRTVTAVFNGGGSALATGNTGVPFTCPHDGTITGWSISVDTGTATFKVWKRANDTAIPTISDVINTSGVAISSGTHLRSTTVTDFTTVAVTAGDQFIVALTAVSGATKAEFELEIAK